MPILVEKITKLSFHSFSSIGKGKKVAIFSPFDNGSKLIIGLPLAFKLASGISKDFKE
jgi:hypothetical protein